ncbi:hypothetical protein CFOL_v3_14396 [Cephalotus follicularis]|uniref:Uncharacterized protein n=1 Tax=Cephalotus follicularis TaxID=3775 RepID=A0A1Q3BSF3_CEPFO|nr:hypothetical protein CFOL_v3_14396 [Cephalotus follicularis]
MTLKKTTPTMINHDESKKEKIWLVEKETENLKIKIDALKKTFSNFSNSSKKLETILGMQICVFDKAGLGYDEMNNVKHYQNFFERKKKIEKEKLEKEDIKKKNLRKKISKRKMLKSVVIIVAKMNIFHYLVFTIKMLCLFQMLLELGRFGFQKEP